MSRLFPEIQIGALPLWAALLVVVALVGWLWSVVIVAKEKTKDPFDRVAWLMVVLSLNVFGTLLYFFFGPKKEELQESEGDSSQAPLASR